MSLVKQLVDLYGSELDIIGAVGKSRVFGCKFPAGPT